LVAWTGHYDPVIVLPDRSGEDLRRADAHVIVNDLDAPRLDEEDRHHLEVVRRMRPGEVVSATDGRGAWRPFRFEKGGTLVADGDVVRLRRPGPAVTVGFAPVKGDRPEWAVQKLTELGVDRIVLLRAERSVVRWEGERAVHHMARLGTVIRQAVMQSRQVWLPELAGIEEAGALLANPGVAIASPGGDAPSLALPTVLVGPEGGWSEAERNSARATVGLSGAVLRTESAAVAAGVLLTALRTGLVRPA
jgi:16S rRNA (uracil1498-N3)-methyltransferase